MKKLWIVFSVVLAAVLAVTAFAADPVLSIDFADGDNGMELVDSELVNDPTRGQVLQVSGMGPSTTGQSYAVLTTDLFKTTNWDDGMTINMWVKSDVGSTTLHGTAPLFSLDIANQGYIGLVASLKLQSTPTETSPKQAFLRESGATPLTHPAVSASSKKAYGSTFPSYSAKTIWNSTLTASFMLTRPSQTETQTTFPICLTSSLSLKKFIP